MNRWQLVLSFLALLVPMSARGEKRPIRLDLELATGSSVASVAREAPVGSGFVHRASVDISTPAIGVAVETRMKEPVALRFGVLVTETSVDGRSVCSPGPCSFSTGRGFFFTSAADWRADGSRTTPLFFAEAPIFVRPNDRFELFAGPTVAVVDAPGVSRRGFGGLIVGVDTSAPSLGLHLGGRRTVGWRGRWSLGLTARWLQVRQEFSFSQPILGGDPIHLANVKATSSLVLVSFTASRALG